ncbi:PUA-like domain-containing protein [Trametes polyzona]|nr:PUA-like domain-containing protein [Trametes polyzona]
MGFSSKPSIKRTKPSTVFGHIDGVPVGSTFENRLFLHHSSVHSGILAGIAGSKHEGCYSVVLSGGYEDDKDQGYKFVYTGCGGRDRKDGEKPREGPQTCDQSWENSRNASLRVSAYTKKPVRVVRGYKSSSDFAPVKGYRYDGLYVVEEAWMDVGKSGFKVCKFKLSRLPGQPPIPRRQGTLNLDLSEWERPKHFGRNSEQRDSDDSDSSSSRSSSAAPSKSRKRKAPLTKSGVPLVRRPKDSDTEEEGWFDDIPQTKAPTVPPKPQSVAPIPPTTNVAAAQRKAAVPQPQAASNVPQPDIHALLAEWSGPALKLGSSSASALKHPAQKVSAEQPCPMRPSASRSAAAPQKPSRAVADDERHAKRVKLSPSSERSDAIAVSHATSAGKPDLAARHAEAAGRPSTKMEWTELQYP